MATLPEADPATFPTGVYQLETTDPVLGGADGASNRPLRDLANRTNWLKQSADRQFALLAALSAASARHTLADANEVFARLDDGIRRRAA